MDRIAKGQDKAQVVEAQKSILEELAQAMASSGDANAATAVRRWSANRLGPQDEDSTQSTSVKE